MKDANMSRVLSISDTEPTAELLSSDDSENSSNMNYLSDSSDSSLSDSSSSFDGNSFYLIKQIVVFSFKMQIMPSI